MYSSHMWNVFTDVNNIGFNICDTDHKILVGGIFLKITKKFLYKIFLYAPNLVWCARVPSR